MAGAGKIFRKAIHDFLRSYQSYTSIAAPLVFPAAVSIFFSQALISTFPSLIQTMQFRIQSLFSAAGYPVSMGFFSLLNLKLSQTIFSLAFTIPFALTFLILAKAAIIQIIFHSWQSRQGPPSFRSFVHLYIPLVQTHIANYFTVLSANAAVFCLFFIAFYIVSVLRFSSFTTNMILSVAGGIVYSFILANVVVACNLAVVISGFENRGGCLQILKAFLLIKGRTSTALSLALPTNLGMTAMEALFHYRVLKAYHNSSQLQSSTVWEAFTIAYLYSIVVVLDTITSCMFFKSCKSRNLHLWGSEIYQQANELLEMDEGCPSTECSKC